MVAPAPDLSRYVVCVATGNLHPSTRACKACKEAPAVKPAAPKVEKPRAGAATEDALADSLRAEGYEVVPFADWFGLVEVAATRGVALRPETVVKEYGWGIHVGRGFRSDFAVPLRMLLVEVEGIVHSVQKQRRNDVRRRQLAEAFGYRVLSVLPEQVKSGEALQLVKEAMNVR